MLSPYVSIHLQLGNVPFSSPIGASYSGIPVGDENSTN